MARTIKLKQLNGDWIVNDASGTNRVWTKGIYSIVYSNNIFNTGSSGWIVKQTAGVEIFAFETTGDPWSSERKIIWNPNAKGYTDNSTAKLNVKTIENDYIVVGAGTNSYNGLYQHQLDLSFNDKNVYKNEDKYLFYSVDLKQWVISDILEDNRRTFAYGGNFDKKDWVIYDKGVSPAPSVTKYFPYMNVKSENIKTGVYVEEVEGQFTSDATATASHIVKGKTAYVKGEKIQGNIEESTPSTIDNEITIPAGIISEQQKITVGTRLQTKYYVPTTTDQNIILKDSYVVGTQIVKGDANLISENIKKDVSIFGVNGSLQQIENVGGSAQSTKLLFRLPWINNEEYYHLFIEFSESNDFNNVEVFNTKNNRDMFKIFTGLGIVDLPSSGINYIFSEKILQLNIADISSSYKYFRFHWTNDEGESFGEYDYGNRESVVQVYGNKQATKLLFRLPQIGEEEYYHLSVQFSESNDFSNAEVFNTKDNMEMFKVFTGLGIVDLPTVKDEQQEKDVSAGINYLFSEKILCMDIRDIEYSYKNFRFHWSNDNCESFGEYDYGNVNANMSALGQVNQKVDFYKCASVDTTNKTWSGYKATLKDGIYSFEKNATEGLIYGDAYTPRVDYIYNSNTTVQISKLWDGIIVPQEGLVFHASLTDLTTAETGQSLTSTLVVPAVIDGIHCAQFSSNSSRVTATIDPINDYGTTSLWFRADNYSTEALLVLSGNSYVEWNIYTRGNYISFGRGGDDLYPAEFSTNTWHHFVCTSNKGVVAIYLDGQNVYSGTLDASGGSNLQLSRSSEPYSGYLANVRVYNRPLDIDEVTLLYNELSPSV